MSSAKRPILICYDGSADAQHAIEQAGELLSGDAVVVTVWQRLVYAMSLYGGAAMAAPTETEAVDRELEAAAKRTAAEGAERAGAAGFDARSETVATTGPLWRAVLDVADEHDAGVIVLGSRGLGGFKSFMLGSVSHGVAQHAHRSVLVIPPAGEK